MKKISKLTNTDLGSDVQGPRVQKGMSDLKSKYRLLDLVETLINLIEKHNLRFGLQNHKQFRSNKRFIFFNPILVNIILIILLIKNIISIFIENDNISKLLSDFSHDWDFSIQWKVNRNMCIDCKFILTIEYIFKS